MTHRIGFNVFSIFALSILLSHSADASTKLSADFSSSEYVAAKKAAESSKDKDLGDNVYLRVTSEIKNFFASYLTKNASDSLAINAVKNGKELTQTILDNRNSFLNRTTSLKRLEASFWLRILLAFKRQIKNYSERQFEKVLKETSESGIQSLSQSGLKNPVSLQLAWDISRATDTTSLLRRVDDLYSSKMVTTKSLAPTATPLPPPVSSKSGSLKAASAPAAAASAASTSSSGASISQNSIQTYPVVSPSPAASPSSSPAAPTLTEIAVKNFIKTWGPDIKAMRKAKTADEFDAIASKLRLTNDEVRRTKLFVGKPNGDQWQKLIIALPRQKVSSGAVLASAKYLTKLGANAQQSIDTVADILRSLSNDPQGAERVALLEYLVRVPSAGLKLRAFIFQMLSSPTLGVDSGLLKPFGVSVYRAELHRIYLKCIPNISEATTLTNNLVSSASSESDKAVLRQQLAIYRKALEQ